MTEMDDEALWALVRQWLFKANSDLISARRLASYEDPTLDSAIYHCQQSAEKSVKTFLVYGRQPIERTHNVALLIELAGKLDNRFNELQVLGALLTPYATAFRYPSESSESMPTTEQFDQAFDAAERILAFVTLTLPKEALLPSAQEP